MHKLIVSTFIFLIAILTIDAQAQNRQVRRAEKSFEQFRFSQALKRYDRTLRRDEGNPQAIKRMADIHRLLNNYDESVKWHAKAVQLEDVDPIYIFHYAQALRTQERYEEAREYYGKYAELNPFDRRARMLYLGMDEVLRIAADSQNYRIHQIPINSQYSQFSPAFYGQDTLVFPSSRRPPQTPRRVDTWTGESFLDLYFVKRYRDGGYTEPQPLAGKINQQFHEGPLTFSPDKKEMYFTRNFYEGRRKSLSEDKILKLEIFHAVFEGGEWVVKDPLPFSSREFSSGHPALTADGNSLYFSSDMPGGFGRGDLYVIYKDTNGVWGEPVNLGEDINTEGEEAFPFVHPDGTLYFSSDGRPGLGGLDIFKANQKEDGSWKVKNLGPPINSPFDDFGLIKSENNEWGYFSTNRPGSVGTDDILRFERIIDVFLKVIVIDRILKSPLEGSVVRLIDEKTKEIFEASTDEEGVALFELRRENEYTFSSIKDGYQSTPPEKVSTAGIDTTTTITRTIMLGRMITGDIFTIDNLYFDYDEYFIRSDAAIVLDDLVSILNEYPTIHIKLISHTDTRGGVAYNQRLSDMRSKSAKEYLISKGIARERLSTLGLGKSKPVNHCVDGVVCTSEEHQMNRRTEIEIVKGLD